MGQGACAEDCGAVAEKVYVLFTINVHDWKNRKSAQSFTTPSDTATTMNKVLDLHEARQIPVDVYLTDPMVSLYEAEAPSLMARFKSSPVVAISYHVRPSAPYYSNFDQHDSWGLPQGGGDTQQWYDALLPYEQHRLVLETGKPDTNKPGGYAQLKKFLGYPPYAVGMVSGGAPKAKALAKIYREMGATFGVVHGVDSSLGDQVNGIYIRPEHVEIKIYEYKNGSKTAQEIIEAEWLEKACDESGRPSHVYMNIKFHENNWYTNGTPWWPCFFLDSTKTMAKAPPFDLSACLDAGSPDYVVFKPQQIQDNLWTLYEQALDYVSARPEMYEIINLEDLQAQLPDEN